MIDKKLNHELFIKQKKIREFILKIAMQDLVHGAHLGGALSAVEIISIIYNSFMDQSGKFILSKGHGSLALYATLHIEGLLTEEDLKSYHKLGSFLLGHPVKKKNKGIDFSTGSLGLGLSLSAGLAYLYKNQNLSKNVFCLVGDGELDEGSNWEAIKFAQHYQLDNLICFIDNNGFQQTGTNIQISSLPSISNFFSELGWEVVEVNGHSNSELFQNISKLLKSKINKPKVVICKTVKGKGIKLLENNNDFHHKIISKSMYEQFFEEVSNRDFDDEL